MALPFLRALLLVISVSSHDRKVDAAAPATLSATSATKSSVSLTWTSGDAAGTKQVVERKALGSAWPASAMANTQPNALPTPNTIAVVTTNAATDDKIDQFTTYVYRIRSIGANNALSAPSNEIIVGPPPVGFNTVIAAPAAMHEHDSRSFGSVVRMAMDANGDPFMAYLTNDLNNDGELEDTDISVITWSRARYRWNAPVSIDTVGNVERAGGRPPFSIARDAATGMIGVLHLYGDHEVRLSTSGDGGMTWKRALVEKHPADEPPISTPALAMANGKTYAAYVTAERVIFRTGAGTAEASTWSSAKSPLLPDAEAVLYGCVSVVLDGAGKPAVSYCLNAVHGYTITAGLWHPDGNQVVRIMDTDGHQADDPALAISSSGTQMAAVFYSPRDDKFFENHHLWFAKSTNNGASWSPAVVIADDGSNAMGAPLTVAFDRGARLALSANVDGGSNGANKCGTPKLIRSGNNSQLSVCAPDTKGFSATGDPAHPTLTIADNDKVYLAFTSRSAAGGLKPGIVLWRER